MKPGRRARRAARFPLPPRPRGCRRRSWSRSGARTSSPRRGRCRATRSATAGRRRRPRRELVQPRLGHGAQDADASRAGRWARGGPASVSAGPRDRERRPRRRGAARRCPCAARAADEQDIERPVARRGRGRVPVRCGVVAEPAPDDRARQRRSFRRTARDQGSHVSPWRCRAARIRFLERDPFAACTGLRPVEVQLAVDRGARHAGDDRRKAWVVDRDESFAAPERSADHVERALRVARRASRAPRPLARAGSAPATPCSRRAHRPQAAHRSGVVR